MDFELLHETGKKLFNEELQKQGCARLKSDGNVYICLILTVIVLVYVDDLMACGERSQIQDVFQKAIPSQYHQGGRSLKRRRSKRFGS